MSILDELISKVKMLEGRVSHLERVEEAMANNHGWIGSSWQKDPIRLGYSGTVEGEIDNSSLSAGTNIELDSAVPAGEIWRITSIAVRYVGTTSGVVLRPLIRRSGNNYNLNDFRSVINGEWKATHGEFFLEEGDQIGFSVSSATAGNQATAHWVGVRIDIDQ